MTYAQYLAVFLGIPLVVAVISLRHQIDRTVVLALVVLAAVAIVYTGPWDNAIIDRGVWSYGARQVTGVLIGHVPLEEYCFYVLQVVLTGLLTLYLLRRTRRGE
jgi:lycopene cyclase domain-containing protein